MAKKTRKKMSDESTAGDVSADATSSAPQGEKITKADAVRAALKQGVEKPQEASAFIKDKFGIDITPQVFSSYKSTLSRKAPKAAEAKSTGDSIDMGSLEAIKGLMEKVGGVTEKRLVDVLAK